MTRSKQDKDYAPRDQYYTPPWVFKALNATFDLDVCAPKGGVPWIPAINSFDEEIDGLAQEWQGMVWMNPPYSQPRPWIEKFIMHGRGIGLIAMSRSNSFYRLWNDSNVGLAVPQKSMTFVTPDGKKKGVFMPVCFIAVGYHCIEILKNSHLGLVR